MGWVKSPEGQVRYAALLSLILLLTLLSSMFDIVIQSVNKIYLARKIRMVKLIIEAILIFSFAYFWGLLGVFIAYIFSNIIYVLLLWHYAQDRVCFIQSQFKFDYRFHDYSIVLAFFNADLIFGN